MGEVKAGGEILRIESRGLGALSRYQSPTDLFHRPDRQACGRCLAKHGPRPSSRTTPYSSTSYYNIYDMTRFLVTSCWLLPTPDEPGRKLFDLQCPMSPAGGREQMIWPNNVGKMRASHPTLIHPPGLEFIGGPPNPIVRPLLF